MIKVTFLGTSAAAPTVSRNVSSIALKREGELMLFDCGEGTQRQMMRFGTGFDVKDVYFTHLHADHFLGIIGFVRTLWMADRQEPMRLFGPPRSEVVLSQALNVGLERPPQFPIEIHELEDGDVVKGDGYELHAFGVDHRINALGYALVEAERPGLFDPKAAAALGVPVGPLFGRLQHGLAVTVPEMPADALLQLARDDLAAYDQLAAAKGGRLVQPSEVLGPSRPGLKVVLSGDTRPCRNTVKASVKADLLIHEATFGDDDQARARETDHSTAREAGRVAREADVRRLVLTHCSSRYDADVSELIRQAREEFPRVEFAKDGWSVEIGYADAEKPDPAARPAPKK
ncbi:MAG TPA: ribonuclease Z [Myxococcales bacterium]